MSQTPKDAKSTIVIVNSNDELFLTRLKYSLEKAKFKITEEYKTIETDTTILVYEREAT